MTPGLIDVETTLIAHGRAPRTRLWGLSVYGEEYRQFSTSGKLVAYLGTRTDSLHLFHHHDYDAIQLIHDGQPLVVQRTRGGRIIRSKLGIHTLGNSYALFPSSLAAILEATGRRKLPLSCEAHDALLAQALAGSPASATRYDRAYDRCRSCQRALADRNRSDCGDGLAALLDLQGRWIDGLSVDPFAHSTAAGVAMAAAKKVAGPMPLDVTHREAYRGGRTEAYQLGDVGTVDVHDVCSSYPASIADAPDCDVLVHAIVTVPRSARIPPVHDAKREDGLFFPTGKVETWAYLSTLEALGFPFRVLERYPVDLSWLHALGPTVTDWYEQKRVADAATAYALKITLNSLYGRLALRPEREIVRYEQSEPSGECTWYALQRGGYLVFRNVRPHEHRANYPLAAYVTDKARLRLYQGMQQVEEKGGRVAYCDTDSIMATPGKAPIDVGTGLGQWKKEPARELSITSVKDYEQRHLPKCPCKECKGARRPRWVEKRKGGRRSMTWTLRRALSGKGALSVEKRRITPYGKRMVHDDGTTDAWDAGGY